MYYFSFLETASLDDKINILRKKWYEIVKLYPKIKEKDISKAFDLLVEADPTNNKAYLQWLITKGISDWKNKDIKTFKEDLPQVNDDLQLFDLLKLKKKLPPENTNLFVLKTNVELYELVKNFRLVKGRTKEQDDVFLKDKDQVQILHNSGSLEILIPKTREASVYFGRDTSWCTARDDNKNMFETYDRKAPLIIVTNKINGKRWQLHFPPHEEHEVSDDKNIPFPLKELVKLPYFNIIRKVVLPILKKYKINNPIINYTFKENKTDADLVAVINFKLSTVYPVKHASMDKRNFKKYVTLLEDLEDIPNSVLNKVDKTFASYYRFMTTGFASTREDTIYMLAANEYKKIQKGKAPSVSEYNLTKEEIDVILDKNPSFAKHIKETPKSYYIGILTSGRQKTAENLISEASDVILADPELRKLAYARINQDIHSFLLLLLRSGNRTLNKYFKYPELIKVDRDDVSDFLSSILNNDIAQEPLNFFVKKYFKHLTINNCVELYYWQLKNDIKNLKYAVLIQAFKKKINTDINLFIQKCLDLLPIEVNFLYDLNIDLSKLSWKTVLLCLSTENVYSHDKFIIKPKDLNKLRLSETDIHMIVSHVDFMEDSDYCIEFFKTKYRKQFIAAFQQYLNKNKNAASEYLADGDDEFVKLFREEGKFKIVFDKKAKQGHKYSIKEL